MNKEQTVRYMSQRVSEHEQLAVVKAYIDDKKGINWQPQMVDPWQVEEAFMYVVKYYAELRGIHVLRNQQGQVIKIWAI